MHSDASVVDVRLGQGPEPAAARAAAASMFGATSERHRKISISNVF